MVGASGGRFLEFTNDYRIFFGDDNPELLAFEELENTYSKNDNVMFVLAPRDGKVFTKQTLSAVVSLTERAWQMPYSTRVDSISNFQYTAAKDDELIVRDLVLEPNSADATALADLQRIALEEPLLANSLISANASVTAVNVIVQLPKIDETLETPEVVNFARDLANDLRTEFPEIDVYLVGMVMMNNAFSESSMRDLQTLIPASFAIMALILALLLRAIWPTVLTVVVITLSIMFAMGTGGWLGFPITPPSASAPIIILTIAIANCVHILVTFLHEVRRGEPTHDAIRESLRVNLGPVFIASTTTAIGFLSMNFSEVPPFRHLGNFVALGVLMSFILAVCFLPAVLSLLPARARVRNAKEDQLMERLGNFVVTQRTALLWGSTALIIALVALIPRNELNDVFVNYFDSSVQFRLDTDFAVENLTGVYQVEYSLESGEANGISSTDYLTNVAAFASWLREQPEVMHVNAITDIMKRLNKNMHADAAEWYKIPEERELAAQYLLLYEMSLPYGLDLNNRIDVQKSATRLTASLETISSNQMLEFEERVQEWLAANAPNIHGAVGTGTTLMFSHIGKRNIKSMLFGSTIALVVISFALILALRSVRVGLISLIPNLVPAAMGFGLWGLLVGEVGLSLCIVVGMTLGIVVDDTVHFLSKYLRARRELHMSPEHAVRYAFKTVGRALLVTSIVLVAGFLVLAMSSFELNSGMGLLTAIVIVLALVADFLFLPALLIKIEGDPNDEVVTSGSAGGPVSA